MKINKFTSKTTAVITMIGVAVGLGNVWRFPYMMRKFGGGMFLFIYLFFVLVFAIPALTGEWALGRHTGRNPFGAFARAFKSPAGRIVAVVLVVSLLIADSYYAVVIGNVIYTIRLFYFSVLHLFLQFYVFCHLRPKLNIQSLCFASKHYLIVPKYIRLLFDYQVCYLA